MTAASRWASSTRCGTGTASRTSTRRTRSTTWIPTATWRAGRWRWRWRRSGTACRATTTAATWKRQHLPTHPLGPHAPTPSSMMSIRPLRKAWPSLDSSQKACGRLTSDTTATVGMMRLRARRTVSCRGRGQRMVGMVHLRRCLCIGRARASQVTRCRSSACRRLRRRYQRKRVKQRWTTVSLSRLLPMTAARRDGRVRIACSVRLATAVTSALEIAMAAIARRLPPLLPLPLQRAQQGRRPRRLRRWPSRRRNKAGERARARVGAETLRASV